jgi:hypothetical protein
MERSVTTHVELNTQQIKFIIDIMWGSPLGIVKQAALHHGIDEVVLEGHLQNCLRDALAELL